MKNKVISRNRKWEKATIIWQLNWLDCSAVIISDVVVVGTFVPFIGVFIFPPLTKEAKSKRKRPKFRNEFMVLKNEAANEGFYRVHEAKKSAIMLFNFLSQT